MVERKKLELISSIEIMNTPMKKQRFIIEGIIYPGLHILSGDPKMQVKGAGSPRLQRTGKARRKAKKTLL